jgi:hypothetical protein
MRAAFVDRARPVLAGNDDTASPPAFSTWTARIPPVASGPRRMKSSLMSIPFASGSIVPGGARLMFSALFRGQETVSRRRFTPDTFQSSVL